MGDADDPFDLARFVAAQAVHYEQALAELRAGRKQTHWIWFVLPQLRGLGTSAMAERYGLSGLAEAKAYLTHPLLGPRLRECVLALLSHPGLDVRDVLGEVDAMKCRSCLTLFARAADDDVFLRALQRLHAAEPCARTLALLRATGDARPGDRRG